MLIIVCRNDHGDVNIVIERKTTNIEIDEDKLEDLQIETMLLFDENMKLVELLYDLG